MVPDEALINMLRRKLNYTYKSQTQRTRIYKKKGGTHRAVIKRNAADSPEYARSILRQAGMDEEEIKLFLASVNN